MEAHTRAGIAWLDAGIAVAGVLGILTVTNMPAPHPG
jgi:hypothetical protein